jgi:methyl-accepting chemotaxis protein
MKRTYKRRNYFIKKGFQGKFVLIFVLISTIGGVTAIGVFNFLAYRKLDLMQYSIHIFTETTGQLLFRDILYANLLALFLVFFLFIFTTIRIFWKITGPLYRIQTDLSKISQGDLSFSIISRSKDEFKDFAGQLNIMIDSFRRRFKEIKDLSQSLTKSVIEMEKVSDKPDMLALKTEKAIEHAKAVEKELKTFNR